MLFLADRLHKTQSEIECLTVNEFNEWMAYFRINYDGG